MRSWELVRLLVLKPTTASNKIGLQPISRPVKHIIYFRGQGGGEKSLGAKALQTDKQLLNVPESFIAPFQKIDFIMLQVVTVYFQISFLNKKGLVTFFILHKPSFMLAV